MTDTKYNSFGEYLADNYSDRKAVEWEDYRLDPEVKRAWIEALRSGRYRQLSGLLRAPSGASCCLGVLGDLFAVNELPLPKSLISVEWHESTATQHGCDLFIKTQDGERDVSHAVLPSWLAYALTVTPTVSIATMIDPPSVDESWERVADIGETSIDLTLLNDSDFTFEQIADVIEYAL